MKVVMSHPTGNRNVRAVITALVKTDSLHEFNTTLAADPGASWIKILPERMRQEWLRRTFPAPSDQICTHPFRELSRMVLPKIGLGRYLQHETGWASIDAVYKDFDKAVARRLLVHAKKNKLSAVYAYEDGALATFKQAKALGLQCIYDLPIAYWETGRKLMLEEAERLPTWANTLGGGIHDSVSKLERKTQELELADLVVGPGQFVMDSLPEWAKEKKIVMVPFGSPEEKKGVILQSENKKPLSERPLRVLFAGSMGQRKGLGDLFAALRLLNRSDIELVVMGSLIAPMEFYRKEFPAFTYEPGRPHDQVMALMRTCDVLCLPSIVEGRALVMQEAMSQGLPLIITPNTGGADLIRNDGSTGFLVPIQSPQAIAEKLTWFLDHRSEIPEMGRMSKDHARTYTWERYGAKIVHSISELTKNNGRAVLLDTVTP